MNAIFSIVAKNYLPLATTLGDTVKRHHPDMPFYIFLADEIDGTFKASDINFPVIEVKEVGIPGLTDMAFKYNVTEFCTAVKPYCFDYLFRKYGYEKLIYFDPDIYVFSSLQHIFDDLNDNFIVLTPHYITPQTKYNGIVPEGMILFVGIYNLGFVAIKNSEKGKMVVAWWMDRLRDKAYADKLEGFHTDQKWMDFIPALFGDGVKISRHLGCNIAIWNVHERLINSKANPPTVSHRLGEYPTMPLTFIHFAGFDPNNLGVVHKHFPAVSITSYPELQPLYQAYRDDLMAHNYTRYIKLPYKYNFFDNGKPIVQFQRRIYKQMVRDGWQFPNPFASDDNSFFRIMKSNGMTVNSAERNIDRINERGMSDFSRKVKLINVGARIMKRVLGFENYALLSKFFLRYFRPENQTFLVKEVKEYHFVNENSSEEA